MTATSLAILLAWVGVLVCLALAFVFIRNPEDGLRQTQHRLEKLPQVMVDRYLCFAFFSAGGARLGAMRTIFFLSAG